MTALVPARARQGAAKLRLAASAVAAEASRDSTTRTRVHLCQMGFPHPASTICEEGGP